MQRLGSLGGWHGYVPQSVSTVSVASDDGGAIFEYFQCVFGEKGDTVVVTQFAN